MKNYLPWRQQYPQSPRWSWPHQISARYRYHQWYPEGFRNSIDYKIGDDQVVQILSTPYFIATKIEAFKGRGEMDGRTSHDFEDIIYVLENRDGIWDELDNAHLELKKYLQNEFKLLLSHPHVFEWIDSHVERGSPPATYTIMDEIAKFIG